MSRSGWARINAIRLSVGIAIVAGWLGLYFAFRGHWLGILLPLLATGILFRAVRAGDRRARQQNADLRDALASAASRNRELERLRGVAATLLAGSELSGLLQEIADAAAELLQAEGGGVTLVVEEGRFVRIAAATGPLAKAKGALIPVDTSLLGTVVTSGTPMVTHDIEGDPRSYRIPGLEVSLRTADQNDWSAAALGYKPSRKVVRLSAKRRAEGEAKRPASLSRCPRRPAGRRTSRPSSRRRARRRRSAA